MKQRFLIMSCIMIMAMVLAACSRQEASQETDLEVVQVQGDRVVYRTLPELIAASDLVVIGEYARQTEQELTYEYSDLFQKDILVDTLSANEISVLKVLKGNVQIGDILTISQRYSILEAENQVVTFSDMTPMNQGDRWIFFLIYDELGDTYWCTGDCDGRYPLPDEEITELCQEAMAIMKARDSLLAGQEKISAVQAEEKLENGDYVYTGLDGTNYSLSKQGAEAVRSLVLDFQEIKDQLDGETFGVYDQSLVNLQLYCDILNTYDLSF